MIQTKNFKSTKGYHIFRHTLLLLCTTMLLTRSTSVHAAEQTDGQADDTATVAQTETIDFQILATSDLHGKVTAFNCETGQPDPKAGLSKLYTMIRSLRSEAGKGNTLLVDAGDSLYDYSVNYIYENFPDDVQPIFQALSTMKYDFITLGNHDFDYPWDYLYNQLDQSNLLSKTLVCNAHYTVSGATPFRTSSLITKRMKTSTGRICKVKVGIVGATYSSFSARRYRYSGFLDGQDIYQSVKAEAAALKAKGADIVVAVVHGGVGLLSGANTSVQPGARLARLTDIDAVVCAHSHETFPSTDGTFSNIANVSEKKGTIHGTPVVQTGSHAQALGTIHLQLQVDENNTVSVVSGKASVLPVTSATKENSSITKLFAPYLEKLRADYDQTEYPIAEGLTYTNTDCVVKDSDLFQLMNNAKLQYAASYIAQYAPEYTDYPLISATVNRLDNREKTISLTGCLTESDISALFAESSSERSSGYVHIYTISGSNLLEWLEYNASIYAVPGTALVDKLSAFAEKNPDVSPLIRKDYLTDWSQFFVFDGISYDIDITKPPRYTKNGKVLNYSHRITNLTYQGEPVTADSKLVIVMDSLEKRYKFMPVDGDSILTVRLNTTSHDLLMDYIRMLSKYGPLNIKADNNWRLLVPDEYRFAVLVSRTNYEYTKAQSWYKKWIKTTASGCYSLGQLTPESQTTNAVAYAGITYRTNLAIPIHVKVYTAPEVSVAEVLYYAGKLSDPEDERWTTKGVLVNDLSFTVKKNAKYSIRVTDSTGARYITYLAVTNYNSMALEQPVVNTMTNRVNAVKGTSRPGSVVYVALPDGLIVSGTAGEDGSYEIPIPMPRFFDFYTIWATYKGKYTSLPVEVTVKKTGANMPTANTLSENDIFITGKTDAYVTLALMLGKKIYVGYGEAEKYKESALYTSTQQIYETDIQISPTGVFSILLPEPAAQGRNYLVYAIDQNGNQSRACSCSVVITEEQE